MFDDLLLARADVAHRDVEPVRPQIRAGAYGDQQRINPQRVTEFANRTFKHVTHAEFLAELPHVNWFALVRIGCVPRDHEAARNMREFAGQIGGDRVGEIILRAVAVQVLEWQDNYREAWRSGRLGKPAGIPCAREGQQGDDSDHESPADQPS